MIQPREIPVYLFTGFLESGKTTFIQETLEDPAFNEGQKTLLLVCEEGEIEYSPIKFASSNVKIVTVDEEEELTGEFLQKLRDEIGFERVVCEFNGMWSLDSLYSSMPDGWTVYQEMSFADARTYLTYNQNMRNLTVDKLKSTETIVFKHFTTWTRWRTTKSCAQSTAAATSFTNTARTISKSIISKIRFRLTSTRTSSKSATKTMRCGMRT